MTTLYPTVKVCASCKREKPLDAFHTMKASSDGLRPSCKVCRKERDRQPKVPIQRPLFVFSKFCTGCQQEKPIKQFNQMKNTKDGYHIYCRECQSTYNHQHRLSHLDEYRARSHAKNRMPAHKARRRKRHQERSVDPYYLELRRQGRLRYYQSHKIEYKEQHLRYVARRLQATVGIVNLERILERNDWICHICGKLIDPYASKRSAKSLDFDHVIPLNPRPGEPQGTHSEDNLKPSHKVCNVRKGNRPLWTLTEFDRRGP